MFEILKGSVYPRSKPVLMKFMKYQNARFYHEQYFFPNSIYTDHKKLVIVQNLHYL